MAARRAAARAAAAVEKETEKKEEKKSLDDKAEDKKEEDNAEYKRSMMLEESKKKEEEEKKGSRPKERVTEKTTERIIICPPGQNQCMPTPYRPYPPQGYCNCLPELEGIRRSCAEPRKNKGKRGRRKGELGGEGICQHPICIMQRAKIRSLGLPLCPQPYRPPQPQPSQPPVVICQKPVLCCCSNCNESDSSDSEGDDPRRDEVANHMTFMNLVLAAANVIKESPNCDQLYME